MESALSLLAKFEPYREIPKVAALVATLDGLARGLHAQLLREFQLQWLVTDPFADEAAPGASFESRQAARDAQDAVRLPVTRMCSCAPCLRHAAEHMLCKSCFSRTCHAYVLLWLRAKPVACLPAFMQALF